MNLSYLDKNAEQILYGHYVHQCRTGNTVSFRETLLEADSIVRDRFGFCELHGRSLTQNVLVQTGMLLLSVQRNQ